MNCHKERKQKERDGQMQRHWPPGLAQPGGQGTGIRPCPLTATAHFSPNLLLGQLTLPPQTPPFPVCFADGQAPSTGEKPASSPQMPWTGFPFSLLPPSKQMKERRPGTLGLCKSLCSWKGNLATVEPHYQFLWADLVGFGLIFTNSRFSH